MMTKNDPAEQLSNEHIEVLWRLTESDAELTPEQRALLAIALRELEQRRDAAE